MLETGVSTCFPPTTADRDYDQVLNVPLTLMGNENVTIQVSIIDDESGEGDEMFMGQLELRQEYPRVELTISTITVTIKDNGMTILFS